LTERESLIRNFQKQPEGAAILELIFADNDELMASCFVSPHRRVGRSGRRGYFLRQMIFLCVRGGGNFPMVVFLSTVAASAASGPSHHSLMKLLEFFLSSPFFCRPFGPDEGAKRFRHRFGDFCLEPSLQSLFLRPTAQRQLAV
jgi:hypothetical protein